MPPCSLIGSSICACIMSVKLLYLPDVTLAAENGVLYLTSTCHIKVTNSVTH
jgi:hypothetical protein